MRDDALKDWRHRGLNEADELLDRRIVEMLENAPAVRVPHDFARRVAAQVPARPAVVITGESRFGRGAAVASLVVLVLALAVLAPRASGVYWTALEWVVCAQFCAVAVWVGIPRGSGDTAA